MKLYVANRETGTRIEEVNSVNEGILKIKCFEADDKRDGTYESNFYDIVDEEYRSMLYTKEIVKILLDKFDKEIYWDDISKAKLYYDYFIDEDYDEPNKQVRMEFNNALYACNDFDEMAEVLNDWYKKNDFLGHEFYTKEFEV